MNQISSLTGTNWQISVSYHYLASSKTRVSARYLVDELSSQIEPFFSQLGLELRAPELPDALIMREIEHLGIKGSHRTLKFNVHRLCEP